MISGYMEKGQKYELVSARLLVKNLFDSNTPTSQNKLSWCYALQLASHGVTCYRIYHGIGVMCYRFRTAVVLCV